MPSIPPTQTDFPPLATFGTRIMICGPSNSGKSTLAVALGNRLNVPAVHLDQLYHVPRSDWVPRPREEFVALHDTAIASEHWVMDGNYSGLFPGRLARATGIILLDTTRWASMARYVRRTLFERHRAGSLEGNRDSLKWKMVRWIMVEIPRKQPLYRRDLPQAGLPFIEVHGMRGLNRLYAAWGLTRT